MPELGLESGVASGCEGYGWPSSSEVDALAPATRRFQADYAGTCWIARFRAVCRKFTGTNRIRIPRSDYGLRLRASIDFGTRGLMLYGEVWAR